MCWISLLKSTAACICQTNSGIISNSILGSTFSCNILLRVRTLKIKAILMLLMWFLAGLFFLFFSTALTAESGSPGTRAAKSFVTNPCTHRVDPGCTEVDLPMWSSCRIRVPFSLTSTCIPSFCAVFPLFVATHSWCDTSLSQQRWLSAILHMIHN